ncbi:tonsoku-like protein [Mya arenaria]|uniref:tonsoku-like protein n=1 Tax=Mya arenaria TaxID=6604 RepID=UPI0022DF0BCF|nr:tonsoku-like protein [Mya arenaria]
MDDNDIKLLKKYNSKKKEAERKADFQDEAYHCTLVADIHSKYGDFDSAVEDLQRALSLYEGLGKQLDIAVACRLLGECHCKRGDFDTALRLHERYLELASACNDKVEEQRALTTIGNTRLSRHGAATNKQAKVSELEKAKSAFTRSLQLCEELKTDARIKPSEYSDMKSRLLYNLGLVYIDIEDTETSLTYLNKALQMFQSISQLDMLFQCQRALADLYQTTGRLAEVKKHLASASATAKRDKDRKAEAEAFQAMALVHVQLDEFPQARHLLKKADKVRLPGQPPEHEYIIKLYKAVKVYEESKRGLASTRETDHSARIPLYEKLADKAVDMGLLKPALKFYQKQLSHSMDAGVGKRELIPIHVSLAQTYADDRKYDKAVVHFQHEIQCRDGSEHEQICRSWLNIAVNQENGGVTNKVIQTSYVNAYNAAKKAGHRKLQVRSLVALSELLKLNGDKKGWEQTETKLSYIRDKYGISESDAEEESQAMEDDDDGGVDEEEVMSDLTDSEEEDEEEEKNVRVVRRPGNRKAHIFVRNQLGETPLHKACIKGSLREVQQLIARGHPLNPQDNNGWTPLHEACNHGFIDIVQALVESGADMNNRGGQGCNGLTPLMDASSNGHREIMALLIKHGANVIAKDDRGQTALSYFEEYLDSAEERGDVQNLNLLETLREKMPEHRGGSRHADILTQKLTSALIPSSPESNQKRAWRKSGTRKPQGSWRGRVETDSDSDSSIGFSQKRNTQRTSLSDVDDSESTRASLSDDQDHGGAEAYMNAISTVGRSAKRSSQHTQKSSIGKKDNRALLDEDDVVMDDWLEDDLGPSKPVRRKNVDCLGLLSSDGTRKRNRSSPNSSAKTLDRSGQSSSQKKRIRIEDSDSESSEDEAGTAEQLANVDNGKTDMDVSDDDINVTLTNIDNEIPMMFEDFDDFIIVESQNIPPEPPKTSFPTAGCSTSYSKNKVLSRKNNSSQKQCKLTDYGLVNLGTQEQSSRLHSTQGNYNLIPSTVSQAPVSNSIAVSNISRPGLGNVLRIKVQVEDTVLMIPVVDPDCSRTFAWLAEEVASRYKQMVGVRLKLSLGKEGARFAPTDLVSLMLENNDKLESYLESRDQQPPMADTYREACKVQQVVFYQNIHNLLGSSDVPGKVKLSNLALGASRIQPVLRAIQHHTTLRELFLSGNRLGDEGLGNLCKILSTIPNLTLLSLTCNDITPEGLQLMTAAATAENSKALQNLGTLELSHNLLCDGSLVQVAGLIRALPILHTLALSSCGLTAGFFHTNRITLTEALHGSKIQALDVSYNRLGCVGLELFLTCLKPTTVTSLDLSAIIDDQRSSQVYRHLYNYATEDGCALQSLTMCDCNLAMEDVDYLTRLPLFAKHLQKINLSNNPKLTNQMLQDLIQSGCSESSMLEEVVMIDTGIVGPLSVEFIDIIAEKLEAALPLRRLEFSCNRLKKIDTDSLQQIWQDKFEDYAEVSFSNNTVVLSVKDR